MRTITELFGKKYGDTIETECFLEYAENQGHKLQEIGELIADAESDVPQPGWYSVEYRNKRRQEIFTARRTLSRLLSDYLSTR